MNQVYLRICLTQLLNTLTVFLFYLFDNPVRNLILSEGYPIIFSTIFVFIFAPLTLTYLICYWLLSGLQCFYSCVQNCCIILHDWGTGVRSCTASWKVCYRGATGEERALREEEGGGGGGLSDETLSVTSLPPSYHSSLPPYIPRQGRQHPRRLRNQEASLTALRGALSEVRQPGSDTWDPRHGLRHNMRQFETGGREGETPLPLQVTPLPPPYRPPPRYTSGPPPQYTDPQRLAAPPGYNDIETGDVSRRDQSNSQISSDTIRQVELGRDIP